MPNQALDYPTTAQRPPLPSADTIASVAAEQRLFKNVKPSESTLKSYAVFKEKLLSQYEALRRSGLQVYAWEGEGEPYKSQGDNIWSPSSDVMRERVEHEGKFHFFMTQAGFGSGSASENAAKHPLLELSPVKTSDGKPMLYNDVFRVVHDAVGHLTGGFSFSTRGEFNAMLAHASTLPKEAWPALFAETFGQNAVYELTKKFADQNIYTSDHLDLISDALSKSHKAFAFYSPNSEADSDWPTGAGRLRRQLDSRYGVTYKDGGLGEFVFTDDLTKSQGHFNFEVPKDGDGDGKVFDGTPQEQTVALAAKQVMRARKLEAMHDKPGPAGLTAAEAFEKAKDGGTGQLTYKQAVHATFLYTGTNAHEWTSTPVTGFEQVTDGERDAVVPVFQRPGDYTAADVIFKADAGGGCCELCGKNIKNVYSIQHDGKKLLMNVGSECVTHFQAGETGEKMAKKSATETYRKLIDGAEMAQSLVREAGRREEKTRNWQGERTEYVWKTDNGNEIFKEVYDRLKEARNYGKGKATATNAKGPWGAGGAQEYSLSDRMINTWAKEKLEEMKAAVYQASAVLRDFKFEREAANIARDLFIANHVDDSFKRANVKKSFSPTHKFDESKIVRDDIGRFADKASQSAAAADPEKAAALLRRVNLPDQRANLIDNLRSQGMSSEAIAGAVQASKKKAEDTKPVATQPEPAKPEAKPEPPPRPPIPEQSPESGINQINDASPKLAELLAAKGGFTMQPIEGMSPASGFAVGEHPEAELILNKDDATPESIMQWLVANRSAFNDPRAHAGAWLNQEDGKVYLDVATVYDSEEQAAKSAMDNGQLGIFDLASGKTITTMSAEQRKQWEKDRADASATSNTVNYAIANEPTTGIPAHTLLLVDGIDADHNGDGVRRVAGGRDGLSRAEQNTATEELNGG